MSIDESVEASRIDVNLLCSWIELKIAEDDVWEVQPYM
jgi:hypothetical protein